MGIFFSLEIDTVDENPAARDNSLQEKELARIWDSILERISTLVNSQSFKTWFEPTKLIGLEDYHLVVEGPNSFFIDWLAEHHMDKIQYAASETLGNDVTVELVSSPTQQRVSPPETNTRRSMLVRETVTTPNNVHLNSRYTFEEFVVGSGNRLAHAAALEERAVILQAEQLVRVHPHDGPVFPERVHQVRLHLPAVGDEDAVGGEGVDLVQEPSRQCHAVEG